jgi:hypothetical protein
MIDDDIEIEHSPLSGDVTRDGVTLRVDIYRIKGSNDGWSLEVVDETGGSTVWTETFEMPSDAYHEFYKTLETEGPSAFLPDIPADRLN